MTRETDRGVHISRRTVLHGALAAPVFASLGACARPPANPTAAPRRASSASSASTLGEDPAPTRAENEFAAFLEDWLARARELVASESPDEDAHLFALQSRLAGLERARLPRRNKDTFAEGGVRSGPVAFEAPIMIIEFELEPGAVIRPHNHVGFDFLSLGLAGDVRVRHFEVDGPAPTPGQDLDTRFAVREVSNTWLAPGRMSSLSRTRANIHMFEAGIRGGRFVDFGIRFASPGDGPRAFSALDIAPTPRDPGQRIFEARWIGNPYARKG